MITLAQALDALRLDEDPTTTGLVQHYIDTLPAAIELSTGVPGDEVETSEDRLLETLELYLVMFWYCPDGLDSDRLRIVISSLENSIKARRIAEQEGN